MHDVAIIGFGPTGAVLAALLGRAGIDTLVVDRLDEVYDKPRAIALDHEILRILQGLGVMEEIDPYVAAYPPTEYRGVDGRIIKRLDAVSQPWPQGWAPNVSFTQPPVEEALRRRATSWPSVSVQLGTEVLRLESSGSSVMLEMRGPSGVSTASAKYVIACDGASSGTRRELGIAFESRDFDEPWLVVDVRVDAAAIDLLPSVNVQYCEPSRPATYVVGPGNHRRWEIMLQPDEDLAAMAQEEHVWRLLERWLKPHQAQLWRSATYRFHALVAERWRDGRVFLAGDAAHQQPPFLGQGMCQGVRDAVNLGWKLALVLRGQAPEALLDTYEAERRPHAIELIDTVKGLGRFICERDMEAARRRDDALIAEMGGGVKTTLRQELVPPIRHGLLSTRESAVKGGLFPQPRAAGEAGLLLDSVTGTGFLLMVGAAGLNDEDVAEIRKLDPTLKIVQITTDTAAPSFASNTDLSFVERDALVSGWLTRNGLLAALVRPDHYVFGGAIDGYGAVAVVAELRSHFQRSSGTAPASRVETRVAAVRRVLTGHDANGRSIVLSDGPSPHVEAILGVPTLASTELWSTTVPANNMGAADGAVLPLVVAPPTQGAVFRVVEFPPDRDWKASLTAGQSVTGGAVSASSNPMMHRTRSIDFAVVMSGEIWAVLDEGEVLLRRGDVMVQRGTNHAWSNRSEAPCQLAFVLVDAEAIPGLDAH